MSVLMEIKMGECIDLTGKKFNKLTVIKKADDYVAPCGKHTSQWLCLCECGNKVIVQVGHLRKR